MADPPPSSPNHGRRVSFQQAPEIPSSKRMLRHSMRSSSSLSAPDRYDDSLLHRAVADAGRWAYGIRMVEVWALSADRTYLFRPDAGWWIDPVWHEKCNEQCQICRLTDEARQDYLSPQNLSPGEGLPGVLWAEASSSMWTKSFRETLASRLLGQNNSGHSFQHSEIQMVQTSNHVVWRNVQQLESDPDQPWNPRLKLLASLGLGWAAAVPFDLHGDQGIVMYLAREGVDMMRVQSDVNESYLIAASDLIGAAYALRGPRQAVVNERRKELANTLRRVRDKILKTVHSGRPLSQLVEAERVKSEEKAAHKGKKPNLLAKVARTVADTALKTIKKSRGGGAPLPPSFSWRQTALSFIGSLLTLLMITSLSERLGRDLGPGYTIVLGPFGALMTLHYGLTAAPASQPRNALLGQIVSLTIGIALSYATRLEVWLRQSLATSLAIASMVKLGITHPPAGASALIFATGEARWGNMAFLLIGNLIAIASATIINNASNKRQYPIYTPMLDATIKFASVSTRRIIAMVNHGLDRIADMLYPPIAAKPSKKNDTVEILPSSDPEKPVEDNSGSEMEIVFQQKGVDEGSLSDFGTLFQRLDEESALGSLGSTAGEPTAAQDTLQ